MRTATAHNTHAPATGSANRQGLFVCWAQGTRQVPCGHVGFEGTSRQVRLPVVRQVHYTNWHRRTATHRTVPYRTAPAFTVAPCHAVTRQTFLLPGPSLQRALSYLSLTRNLWQKAIHRLSLPPLLCLFSSLQHAAVHPELPPSCLPSPKRPASPPPPPPPSSLELRRLFPSSSLCAVLNPAIPSFVLWFGLPVNSQLPLASGPPSNDRPTLVRGSPSPENFLATGFRPGNSRSTGA